MSITVYTKPVCVQCRAVKRLLDQEGASYEEVDLMENLDKLEEFKAQGIMTAPVTTFGDTVIAGFNPDAIKDLLKPS